MKKNSLGAACATVLVALAGALATPMASHAAIYGGVFDPRGDVYGFAGTHKFAVDDSCLVTTGWKYVNGWSNSGYDNLNPRCGNVFLVGGTLTLRKYAAPGTGDDGPRAIPDKTFNLSEAANDWDPALNWGSGVGGMQYYIHSIYVDTDPLTGRNELFGVDTPELFGSFGPFDGLNWAMSWVSGKRPGDPVTPAGVKLFGDCTKPFDGQCAGVQDVIPMAGVTFTRVPEPGSLALVAAALGAAVASSRRMRRA